MKKKFLFLCGFLAVFLMAFAASKNASLRTPISNEKIKTQQSNNMENNVWKEIDDLLKKGSTASAKTKLQEVRQKLDPKDEKSLLLAEVYRLAVDLEFKGNLMDYKNAVIHLDENEYNVALLQSYENVKSLRDNSDDKSIKAVSSFFMAQILTNYSHKIRYSTRSEVEDENRPENMSEWSFEEVKNQAIKHFEEANADLEDLVNVPMSDFYPLFKKNENMYFTSLSDAIVLGSLEGFDDLYADNSEIRLFASESINNKAYLLTPFNLLIPRPDAPQQINLLARSIAAHKAKGDNDVVILLDLKRLKYLTRNSVSDKEKELAAYDSLIAAYPNNESVILAHEERLNILMGKASDTHDYADVEKQANDVINKFPDSPKIDRIYNVISKLHTKSIRFYLPERIRKGEKLELEVSNTNAKQVSFSLYKIDASIDVIRDNRAYHNSNSLKKYYKPISIENNTFSLSKSNYLEGAKDTILLSSGLDYGYYALKATYDEGKESDVDFFMVSDLDAFCVPTGTQSFLTVVTDSKSGAPVKDATVKATRGRKGELIGSKSTDADGFSEFTLSKKQSRYERCESTVEKGKDFIRNYIQADLLDEKEKSAYIEFLIFTDRPIYRPSQTVKFKGVYVDNAVKKRVLSNESIDVVLMDGNWNQIEKKTFKTDDFGAISGEFQLPQGLLLGDYSILVMYKNNLVGNHYFKVEEYKRPTFEVVFDKVEDSYQFGKQIQIKGVAKALSGEPLANASVKFTIEEKMWWTNSETSEMSETTTDEDGRFALTFDPVRDEERLGNCVIRYQVTADVTNKGGETQKGLSSFFVADYDMRLQVKTPSLVEKNAGEKVMLKASSYNGKPQSMQVEMAIYRDKEKYELDEPVWKQNLSVNDTAELDLPVNLLSVGQYILKVKELADNTFACTSESNFMVYDKTSTQMPCNDFVWTDKHEIDLSLDEAYDLSVGSACDNAYVLEVVYKTNQKASYRWIKLNNQITSVTFKGADLFKDNDEPEKVSVYYLLMKNDVLHEQKIVISKRVKQKSLNFSLSSFREVMTPGAKEKWTIKFDKLPSQADVVCGMYDASLDAYDGRLNWPTISSPYIGATDVYFGHNSASSSYFGYSRSNVESVAKIDESANPIWYGLVNARVVAMNGFRSVPFSRSMPQVATLSCEMAEEYEVSSDAVCSKTMMPPPPPKAVEELCDQNNETADVANFALRQNFTETAFFYPSLKSEKDGTVSFTFTMPDALTRWNFLAFAHTKDLYNGLINQQVTTQLPFMVKPTLPRFVRIGDEQHFTATVNNISGEARDVEVKMIVTDAESGDDIKSASQKLSLKEKQATVDFSFLVPDKVSAIEVKLFAVSGDVSDGEQHLLAVLPRGMRVNKSVNIIAKKGENKSVSLPTLEKEAENKEVTLEYSANAAWNALMAMPKVNYNTENAIDMALAVYVNGLSQDIGEKYPSIKRAVEQWQKTEQGVNRSVSPLEQNAELKNILLNETPWVMEAKRETEWRGNVANALDPSRAKNDNEKIIGELAKLQNNDGGFAWWPGMPSSLYTTISVAEQFSRLNSRDLLKNVNGGENMLALALSYLDDQVEEDYIKQKREYNRLYVNEWHAHLMMIRLESKGVKDIPEKIQKIYDEYIDIAKKDWGNYTLYGKSCFALAMKFNGNAELAKEIVNNLRENISVDENGARHWRSNIDSWNWYGSDIRSHAMAMTALAKIDRQQDEQDDLSLWLLLRKRTTMWSGAVPSVDAICAIIDSNADGVKSMLEPSPTTLTWGDHSFSTVGKGKKVGEQYVKKHVGIKEFKDNLTSLSVSQSKDVPGYGALYISYDCPFDAVESAKSGISVEKKTYLCKKADSGDVREVLTEVKDGQVLHLGDKIKVLLSVKVDQTLDFVCLKDLRAATCEPGVALSGYYRADNTYCYRSFTDSSVRFFFDRLNKGTYVFEYTMHVTHKGTYGAGIATVQCQYAPSYQGNSASGVKLIVE